MAREDILFRPKILVDSDLKNALKEALERMNAAAGRMSKPFKSARALVRSLKRPPPSTMRARWANRFRRDFRAAPPAIQSAFEKQLAFLLHDL